MELFKIENLTFTYPNSDRRVLDNVSFEIAEGEFALFCGESGCGKSTLLRLLKKQLQPHGEYSGNIFYYGEQLNELDERLSVADIGFVMQNPDNQIVTDKVWHELAFGLESLGESDNIIHRKVAEISGFFGINEWYRKKTSELSGGQKQLLNLASIMVMNPKVLILDEPTSQLDPIAASEFLATLNKINTELGITIILVEHRLEEIFPYCSKVFVMDDGKILISGKPQDIGKSLSLLHNGHKMNLSMPTSVRLYNELTVSSECPLSVKEARDFLKKYCNNEIRALPNIKDEKNDDETAVELKDVYFRYEKSSPDILNGLTLKIFKNELLCIVGGNGAGKSTCLKAISGLIKPYGGAVKVWNKKIADYKGNSLYRHNLSSLPQNPQTLFLRSTVYEDLMDSAVIMGYNKTAAKEKIDALCSTFNLSNFYDKHPYDLSGGEQQKLALAKVLMMDPKIILLDEPTKGVDAYWKTVLAEILFNLKAQGKTIVMVTHDIEFAASYADRCAMFFDGKIVSSDNPVDFFSGNNYYTTSAYRISRNFYEKAVTCQMLIKLSKMNAQIAGGVYNEDKK